MSCLYKIVPMLITGAASVRGPLREWSAGRIIKTAGRELDQPSSHYADISRTTTSRQMSVIGLQENSAPLSRRYTRWRPPGIT